MIHNALLQIVLLLMEPNVRVERISTEHGLSQNSIYCILQDFKGFLWVGTENGLNRYDGYRFKSYRHDPQKPASLSNNYVMALCEDHTGALWAGTAGGGLNRFDREREVFRHFRHHPADPFSLSHDVTTALYEDSKGNLWIGTRFGLNRFDPEQQRFIRYMHDDEIPSSLSHNRVFAIAEDHLGTLWVGTADGLNRYEPETGTFKHHAYDSADHSERREVFAICEDREGFLWVGTRHGTVRFDLENERFTRFKHDPADPNSLDDNRVLSLYRDRSEGFWVGTGKGINRFDRDRRHFIHGNNEEGTPWTTDEVITIYEDRTEVLWLGTSTRGLIKINRNTEQFQHYRVEPAGTRSTKHNVVISILEDPEDRLWIGTFGDGLKRFTPGNPTSWVHYKSDPKNPRTLSSDRVWALHRDGNGVLWIGTSQGLDRFEETENAFRNYRNDPNNPKSLSGGQVLVIGEDRENVLWVGTTQGLNRFDRDSGTFVRFQNEPGNEYSLSHNSIEFIHEDATGVFWIGTSGGGLNRFDRTGERFTRYRKDPDQTNSLSHDEILSVYEDKNGFLWIGTSGGGLNQFDPAGETFTHYRKKDGLPDDVVYGVLGDAEGNLWMSTNRGLARLDPKAGSFKTYDIDDGLQDNEFSVGAFFQSPDGQLFFGGINGLNAFYPERMQTNPIPPPLAITEFSLYGQPVPVQNDRQDSPLKKNISEAQGLTLTHENDVFSLEFAALDFINPKKNRYAYKLVGFDKDWTETDARGRTATYTGLAPGQYRFEVKGSNSDGLWNEEGTSLDITILPAPWKTWWAKSLYVLAFIATVLGIANLISSRKKLRDERLARERLDQLVAERTRTLQEKQNQLVSQAEQLEYQAGQLREMDALKTRFFTNISHELRTPLSLIIGNLTEMQGKGDFSDLTQASLRHAVELTDLVEQFLDVSKIDAGCLQMKPCRQDILPLARDTVSSFLPLAERKGILLRFCVEEGPLVFTFDSDHLRKVINNLLANAFRHTSKGGKIWVSIQRRELQAVIEVQDTGCGIPEHHLPHIFDRFYQVGNPGRGTGIGLSYARDLVALHGGQIEVDSKPGFGSRFTVKLPLDRPHFSKTAEQGKPRLPVIAETASPEKHQGDREDASEADVHRPRVLIVEDHLELRAFLKRHLQKQYAVLEADNGEEGLQSALSTVPDLIISDIMMPAMDGIELCKRLRKRKQTAHIPILLLTAKVEQADEIAGLQAGADDYVRKPFDLDTLLIRVDHLLQTHRLADSAKIVFEPTEVEVPSQGEVFMERLTEILDRNLSDERFNVSELSEEMGLSPRHLRRKLRALTGKPTAVLIREYRLKRAAQLLRRHAGNVSEIAYMVGFHKPDYFSTLYKEFHGESPSEAITRGADL